VRAFAVAWRTSKSCNGCCTISPDGRGHDGSTACAGRAMFRLDLHTRIALTARLGAVRSRGRQTDAFIGFSSTSG
jgi:hypothetical protein